MAFNVFRLQKDHFYFMPRKHTVITVVVYNPTLKKRLQQVFPRLLEKFATIYISLLPLIYLVFSRLSEEMGSHRNSTHFSIMLFGKTNKQTKHTTTS